MTALAPVLHQVALSGSTRVDVADAQAPLRFGESMKSLIVRRPTFGGPTN